MLGAYVVYRLGKRRARKKYARALEDFEDELIEMLEEKFGPLGPDDLEEIMDYIEELDD
jgi:hypothetical protein